MMSSAAVDTNVRPTTTYQENVSRAVDAAAALADLRRLAKRARLSEPEEILKAMEAAEIGADVEIGFGRLGEPLSTEDIRSRLRRMRR